jgi:hypothetical protein
MAKVYCSFASVPHRISAIGENPLHFRQRISRKFASFTMNYMCIKIVPSKHIEDFKLSYTYSSNSSSSSHMYPIRS